METDADELPPAPPFRPTPLPLPRLARHPRTDRRLWLDGRGRRWRVEDAWRKADGSLVPCEPGVHWPRPCARIWWTAREVRGYWFGENDARDWTDANLARLFAGSVGLMPSDG